MMSMSQIFLMSLAFYHLDASAIESYLLRRYNNPPSTKIYCSASEARLFPSMNEESLIGIYKVTSKTGHACYNKTKAGLVTLSSLTGGKLYTTGK